MSVYSQQLSFNIALIPRLRLLPTTGREDAVQTEE